MTPFPLCLLLTMGREGEDQDVQGHLCRLTVVLSLTVGLSSEDAQVSLPQAWSLLLAWVPGLPAANLPSQFLLLLAEIFPIATTAEHRMPSLFPEFVIPRKADNGIAGNHCCCV
ncbi:Sco-Spondin [Manis pentadactyla]|nr:Sco-Spondin [Manis pentadactyla]